MKIILDDNGDSITIITEFRREQLYMEKVLLKINKKFHKVMYYTKEIYEKEVMESADNRKDA